MLHHAEEMLQPLTTCSKSAGKQPACTRVSQKLGDLAALPQGVVCLSSLQMLDLQCCMRLAVLPQGICYLISLQALDLGDR